MTFKRNVWMIFTLVFITSLAAFSYYAYYGWQSTKQEALNKQQAHIELFGNSVRAFIESQESLLSVLGLYLISQHHLPDKPIHDAVLDSTMVTYNAFLGLGLVAYDGRALVASSNFDLEKLPNLMTLEQTRESFSIARDSQKIQTGPTYVINALEAENYAMPIRKAIYLPDGAPQAVAVMTAGIRLDNTPIFDGHDSEVQKHMVEIIRRDKYPVFSTDENVVYTQQVDEAFYLALRENTKANQNFTEFQFSERASDIRYHVVSYYDEFLDFWFVSKIDEQYVIDSFVNRITFAFYVFSLYNILLLTLTHAISRNEKERAKVLFNQAHHDSLTNLPNRHLLFDKLHGLIEKCNKSSSYHALLFLDIDDFKTINDTHGHEHGDALLKEAAIRIQRCLLVDDTLARFGGDEFVVLLRDLGESSKDATSLAETVASKLLDTLSETYELNEYQYTSSASIGAVLFNSNSFQGSELLKQADIAMYKAKHSGKNAVCFFNPEMQAEVASLFELENALRVATREAQFELFYQPQVDYHGNVLGAEALLRWHHPERGLMSPYDFVSAAEKAGLIVSIGTWVLEEACRQLLSWQQLPRFKNLTLSVNISYKQLREPGFTELVKQLVSEYKIKEESLYLELTETVFVDNMESTINTMNELRDIGILFSLDDFGTGYSSLKYLKKLPLNHLKIDKSFVDDLETDKSDQSIVRTIILMSEALGLHTIAEGVETKGQRDYLNNEGCLHYQGYLFGKPLPVGDFQQLI
ncbi:putative bifunctional diguanylate cyclase/phosphodiesterase [Vibrio sp. HN007]|uniref:putative bifunctional diguanylate cyclase/phosphodiesterase n=1 Tax=Vibrio iocasae TaxID=3098914 RepID=UPI0035D50F41